ncbi:MAG TPA: VWA domain-containing protein [Acidimicrobiia bacterium]|nr:VWA domain-containing protein [Acidimicrobiia bacterium]
MTLLAPSRLWLLVLVAALAAAYLWLQRHRRHRAVRFTNLELLRSVAPKRPGWRRHLPAAGVGLALVALVVGFARPAETIRVPKQAATVMLVMDMSASMQATDVSPSRVDAAIDAAENFVKDLPPQVRVGLISFDRSTRMVASPTVDHDAVLDGLAQLTLGPGTAAGDALFAALDAVAAAEDAAGLTPEQAAEGSAIVLLSDGVTTVGSPVLAAAQEAADQGIPVTTIAFGTESGTVRVQGELIPVPADPDTMAQVAELTSGKFFEAVSADELRSVYEDIGTRVGYDTTQRDASGPILSAAALALTAAFALGLLWNGRLV